MRPLQKEIINALKVRPSIDPDFEIRRTIDFLKHYLLKHPFLKGYVLGISGGQDSTLAGALAQRAINELNAEQQIERYTFYAMRLPYGIQVDEQDAMAAIQFMQANEVVHVNIKDAVDASLNALQQAGVAISDFNKGNIKARERMIAQYALAAAKSCAVIGTDHAAEAVTGFYTKFGDGAADIMPLWRLTKRQGKALLQTLEAPRHLYEKIPTADLEEERPSLPDEVALGVTYQAIDDYLEGHEVDAKAAETIEKWYVQSQHKRHLPITIFDEFWK